MTQLQGSCRFNPKSLNDGPAPIEAPAPRLASRPVTLQDACDIYRHYSKVCLPLC